MTETTPGDDSGTAGKATADTGSAASVQDSWKQGVDKLREVTKWLITAFAATGAVLAGTAPLAGLGEVTGLLRVAAVLVGAAAALGGIVWTIYEASRVLIPEYTTLDTIADSNNQDLEAFRELIDNNIDVTFHIL